MHDFITIVHAGGKAGQSFIGAFQLCEQPRTAKCECDQNNDRHDEVGTMSWSAWVILRRTGHFFVSPSTSA